MDAEPGEKVNWDRETPAVPLSVAEVEEVLAPWLDGRRVAAVKLLSGGLVNRNVRVTLVEDPTPVVLRVYDRDAAAQPKELSVLVAVRALIPAPDVLYSAAETGLGVPIALLSWMPGLSLRALRATGDMTAVDEAAYDAGRILARLQPFAGPPTPVATTESLIEQFTAAPAFQARIERRVARQLIDAARRWQPRLEALPSSLVHGDFNSPNIFVAQLDGTWRVSAVLDWEFALHATPYCDIGNFLRYHRSDRPRYEPGFSRGLRDGGRALPPDWLMLARLADLPALCELLSRNHLPEFVVSELRLLIDSFIDVVTP